MIDLRPPFRRATPDDDTPMAELVNIAGEGLPHYLWSKSAAPGGDPWDVGRERARRESGAFSYRNTVFREEQGRVAAALIGYPLADSIEPADYDNMPAMFVPMQQLEDQAPGTWYVNVLATYPEYRGRGHGRALLELAERLAAGLRKQGLSIIVSDANTGARRLYERCGYRERARRPLVKEQWDNAGSEWVLLVKSL